MRSRTKWRSTSSTGTPTNAAPRSKSSTRAAQPSTRSSLPPTTTGALPRLESDRALYFQIHQPSRVERLRVGHLLRSGGLGRTLDDLVFPEEMVRLLAPDALHVVVVPVVLRMPLMREPLVDRLHRGFGPEVVVAG